MAKPLYIIENNYYSRRKCCRCKALGLLSRCGEFVCLPYNKRLSMLFRKLAFITLDKLRGEITYEYEANG